MVPTCVHGLKARGWEDSGPNTVSPHNCTTGERGGKVVVFPSGLPDKKKNRTVSEEQTQLLCSFSRLDKPFDFQWAKRLRQEISHPLSPVLLVGGVLRLPRLSRRKSEMSYILPDLICCSAYFLRFSG